MELGPGVFDVTNADVEFLVRIALGWKPSRITVDGVLPKTTYGLHVHAPGADPERLHEALELAIANGAAVHLERHTAMEDVYLLEPLAGAGGKLHLEPSTYSVGGFYMPKTATLQLVRASLDDVAGGLEQALGLPVVNDCSMTGSLTASVKLPPHDLAAAKQAMETNFGLTLVAARRPIERIVLSAVPAKPSPKQSVIPVGRP